MSTIIRSLTTAAILLVASLSGRAASPGMSSTPAAMQPATLGGDRSSTPPQQPSDPPLLVATSPDLAPAGGPLVATAIADPGGLASGATRSINLPPGFAASIFAAPGGAPRFMALAPDGGIFVALQGAGKVVQLLPDAGGAFARAQTVLDGLNAPSSLAFFGGYLYVGETNQIDRLPYADGQVDSSGLQVVVPNLPTGGHFTRTVAFGPDGRMYVSVGSSCNVCIEDNPRRAAVGVYDPDGANGRLYASGLRNAVGLAWQPDSGDLWATVNGRDDVGQDMGLSGAAADAETDNLPPDYVTRLSDGGNYGWPRCYGDHQLDPKFGDAAFCAATLAPSVEVQAHSAPLGLAFYSGAAFPADYQGDLFVAFHGSWNRTVPTGHKIVRIHFAGGQPVRAEDFATTDAGDGKPWGRPAGLLVLPDGSLLVSDDDAGLILRISYSPNPASSGIARN